MKLVIENLHYSLETAEIMAEFGKPITEFDLAYLKEKGLLFVSAVGCMEWIWFQWLVGGTAAKIRKRVEPFLARGMEMQRISSQFYMRPRHDLYLLHCAIFAANDTQLEKIAKGVVDASGYKEYKPKDDGELYASAWCGMLKYWILGDRKKAIEQSDLIWNAYRSPSFSAVTKFLVIPWLKEDWKTFVKAQQKDFDKLWNRGRRNGTVRSETEEKIVVTVQSYPYEQLGSWAHCGLALLAYRRGANVATDPFWFPAQALKAVPQI